MAKPYGGPTNSLGGVERSVPTGSNRSENIDIDNLLNPMERYHTHPPLLENPPEGEADTQKLTHLEKNIREQKRHEDEETTSIKSETKRFSGMRIEEADKNSDQSFLALGNEGKKILKIL